MDKRQKEIKEINPSDQIEKKRNQKFHLLIKLSFGTDCLTYCFESENTSIHSIPSP
jgi:hypothetical protein